MNCEICDFKNPKGSVTAVIIKNGKLLLLKRNQEPFLGKWDFPGGYMDQGETPEQTVLREVKEELGINGKVDFINWFPGTAFWKSEVFPVLNHAYLTEIKDEIILNKEENSDYVWQDIGDIKPEEIAFDSNQSIVKYLQKNIVNFSELRDLIRQLDSSANIDEINFYRSLLNGYLSKKVVDGKLVGAGWIYARQTLLRKQAVLEDIIVDENHRKKGYGEEITADLIRWAKENGVQVIELTTNPKRIAANSLYQKLGFNLHPTNHYLYMVQ
ncbi:MAG: GNAT family N-acetyltransferase [Candidatus Staskawiczbacteria bacterium]|nr:GNAT family N-acetyltransferase [Candidatus Staskawiczbacteria bacterium]